MFRNYLKLRFVTFSSRSSILSSTLSAWPVAYYAMNRWLQNFAYRINIGLVSFVLAGVLAFTIAIITVSFQSIRAALANPVESLRYE